MLNKSLNNTVVECQSPLKWMKQDKINLDSKLKINKTEMDCQT